MASSVDALAHSFWQAPSADHLKAIRAFCLTPDSPAGGLNLYFNAAMHLRQFDDARQAWSLLQARAPDHPFCTLWPVELDMAQGREHAALAGFRVLSEPRKHNPDFLRRWINSCIAQDSHAGLDLAAPCLTDLPDGLNRFLAQAALARYRHQPQAEIEAHRNVLTVKPDHIDSVVKLAALLETRGDRPAGLELLQAAVQRAPQLIMLKGLLLGMRLRQDPALITRADLEDYMARAQNPKTALGLALSWATTMGDAACHAHVLERMETDWPERARIERAEQALADGQPREALTLLRALPTEEALHRRHFDLRAKALSVLGDQNGLRALAAEIVGAFDSPLHHAIAASIAIQADDMDSAARLARHARQADPGLMMAWTHETIALTRNGQGAAALDVLAHLPPDLAMADPMHERRHVAARAIGDFETARTALTHLADQGPARTKYTHVAFLSYLGQIKAAKAALRAWIPDNDADDLWKQAAQGKLRLDQFHTAGALAWFDTCLADNPQFKPALAGRATAHLLRFDPQSAMADLNTENRLQRVNGAKPRRARDGFLGQLANELLLDPPLTQAARQALIQDQPADRLLQLFRDHSGNTMLAIGVLVALRQQGALGQTPPAAPGPTPPTHIPARIFQYWEGTPPTADLAAAMDRVARLNPWAAYHRFDGASGWAYIRAHACPDMVRAFRLAKHAAERADLLRLVVLEREGGIWVDADDMCRADLSGLIPPQAQMVLYQEWMGSVGNNFIATTPGNAILRRTAEQAQQDILSSAGDPIWLRTGPGALTRALVQDMAAQSSGPAMLTDGLHILSESHVLHYLACACPFAYKQSTQHWLKDAERRSASQDAPDLAALLDARNVPALTQL